MSNPGPDLIFMVSGLIAAACGQLDAVLQNHGYAGKGTVRRNVICNGQSVAKAQQDRNANRTSNGSLHVPGNSTNGVH